ncbi:MAG: hypothetical protein J0H39_19695 [Alphaproteobacteria bacterium]|jgi:methylmalonyl-CoA mutase|nr:hypothetical protein [Alphaproteobacteria bacterium]
MMLLCTLVGVSSQVVGHKTLAPALIAALKGRKADDILVVCGGVILRQDYDELLLQGMAAIYGPGVRHQNNRDCSRRLLTAASAHLSLQFRRSLAGAASGGAQLSFV